MESDIETTIKRIRIIKNLFLILALVFLIIGVIAHLMGYGNKIYYIIELICLFFYYPISIYYDRKKI